MEILDIYKREEKNNNPVYTHHLTSIITSIPYCFFIRTLQPLFFQVFEANQKKTQEIISPVNSCLYHQEIRT